MKTARQEGLEEGIGIGIKKVKLEIARNCLKNGLSVEMTVKITGLTEEEVREENSIK